MALRLPRFIRDRKIVTDTGFAELAFLQWWDQAMTQIEVAINGIQDALTAAGIALAAADAAQDAADAAQGAADTVTNVAKLTTSGCSGLTLTATDAGSDVTINISAHTRVYGDGTSVSVNSGSLTGLAYSTLYYVYYDDPGFSGGAVTYLSTTDQLTAAQTGVRHLVGAVNTPAALGAPTDGGFPKPPGQDFEIP